MATPESYLMMSDATDDENRRVDLRPLVFLVLASLAFEIFGVCRLFGRLLP